MRLSRQLGPQSRQPFQISSIRGRDRPIRMKTLARDLIPTDRLRRNCRATRRGLRRSARKAGDASGRVGRGVPYRDRDDQRDDIDRLLESPLCVQPIAGR